jgi:gliding motility-associated-like protein
LTLSALSLAAQKPVYEFSLKVDPVECAKGSAKLEIGGVKSGDSTSIEWSTGQRNLHAIGSLEEGDYSLRIYLKRKQDSLVFITDTTLYYNVPKLLCPIGISKHFSPNDDGYNDLLGITHVQNHPEFEFHVYNKWGQRVHFQKKEYKPWDGTWNGLPLPDGTYYYVFFYKSGDKDQIVKGDVTILR